MAFREPGPVESVSYGLNWISLRHLNGETSRIDILAENLVRVRFSPWGDLSSRTTGAVTAKTWPGLPVAVSDTGGLLIYETPKLRVEVDKLTGKADFYWPDRGPMLKRLASGYLYDPETATIVARAESPAGDRYLGMGARGGPTDRRGRKFSLTNVDRNGYGPLSDPLYISIPFFYSFNKGRAYGLFLDNAALPFFDFGADSPGELRFGVGRGDIDFYVIAGPSPTAIASTYARLTGACPLPPKWALGYHQSRYSYYSQAELLEVAGKLRTLKIPADVLWLDIDYMDRFHQFTWNREAFPDPVGMNAQLDADGFKRININEPCVLKDDPIWEDASSARFFLTDQSGKTLVNDIWLGSVSWLDFSRRPLRVWYKERLKRFLATGITGLWNDLNEPAQNFMPEAVYDYNGERRQDLEARNLYALEMVRVAREALEEMRPNERPWMISRSGFSGIHRYSANWSGDANSDWEALRTNLQMTIAMGISGQEFFGHDTGGFLGSPSPELFLRWLQFSLYTALFRNHAINDAERREPWAFPDPYLEKIRATINDRYRLLPLLYSLMERACRLAEPFVAPLSFHFPADDRAFEPDNQYMLGANLLVAPITAEGQFERDVYLPGRGAWVDIHSGEVFPAGSTVRVAAPIDYIPVLAREGAILPRGGLIQHTGEDPGNVLEVAVFPGRDTSFSLYEDDGASLGYTRGEFLRTAIDLRHSLDGIDFSMQKEAGSKSLPPRVWMLTVHRILDEPKNVTFKGQIYPRLPVFSGAEAGWYFDPVSRRLLARIEDPGEPFTLRIRP